MSAITFIQSHAVNGFRKTDEGRVEHYSYPARSITEGVVNAIANRNYFIKEIQINMFKDRLESTTPRTLLNVSALKKEKNSSSIIFQKGDSSCIGRERIPDRKCLRSRLNVYIEQRRGFCIIS